MRACIDGLFEICKEQPFNAEKIKAFIKSNRMSSEEITRAALRLCDYGMFSYSDYLYEREKEPLPSELRTYNWEALFNILIDNGLDPGLVICDDGINYECVMEFIKFFDDGDLAAEILRNVLSNGISPNTVIGGVPFFEGVNEEFIADIDMCLYQNKWQLDKAFRFWLVLIGFGGVINGDRPPVKMCDNYSVEIFKNFESFDYVITYVENDFELKITEKETQKTIAFL